MKRTIICILLLGLPILGYTQKVEKIPKELKNDIRYSDQGKLLAINKNEVFNYIDFLVLKYPNVETLSLRDKSQLKNWDFLSKFKELNTINVFFSDQLNSKLFCHKLKELSNIIKIEGFVLDTSNFDFSCFINVKELQLYANGKYVNYHNEKVNYDFKNSNFDIMKELNTLDYDGNPELIVDAINKLENLTILKTNWPKDSATFACFEAMVNIQTLILRQTSKPAPPFICLPPNVETVKVEAYFDPYLGYTSLFIHMIDLAFATKYNKNIKRIEIINIDKKHLNNIEKLKSDSQKLISEMNPSVSFFIRTNDGALY